jgi:hypothetical protein
MMSIGAKPNASNVPYQSLVEAWLGKKTDGTLY